MSIGLSTHWGALAQNWTIFGNEIIEPAANHTHDNLQNRYDNHVYEESLYTVLLVVNLQRCCRLS